MKSYIVDRSGSTPQLNEMPTNVEKIYPTKADAEAALANGDIADGEFVSTVDTVETDTASKDYIRKQNLLAGWETITLSTTASVMDYDGFINVIHKSSASSGTETSGYTTVTINGTEVFTGVVGAQGWASANITQIIPVNKGDEVVLQYTRGSVTCLGNFYKLRDYSDRS